jgi:hypothetical protein
MPTTTRYDRPATAHQRERIRICLGLWTLPENARVELAAAAAKDLTVAEAGALILRYWLTAEGAYYPSDNVTAADWHGRTNDL